MPISKYKRALQGLSQPQPKTVSNYCIHLTVYLFIDLYIIQNISRFQSLSISTSFPLPSSLSYPILLLLFLSALFRESNFPTAKRQSNGTTHQTTLFHSYFSTKKFCFTLARSRYFRQYVFVDTIHSPPFSTYQYSYHWFFLLFTSFYNYNRIEPRAVQRSSGIWTHC